jgi:hypothetical protein
VPKVAPALAGSDLREACLVIERDGSPDTAPTQDFQLRLVQSQLRISDVDQLTDNLEIMADWFDRLRVEIRRANLLWDLGLLTEQHLDGLARRVAIWREAAEALADTIPGSLVTVDEEQAA